VVPPGTFTFTVRGTDNSGNTQDATFTWTLTDPCFPPTTQSLAAVPTSQYDIGVDTDVIYPDQSVSPNYCPKSFDVTIPSHAGISKQTTGGGSIKVVRFAMTDLTYLVNGSSTDLTKNADLVWTSTVQGYFTEDTTDVSRTDSILVRNPCVLANYLKLTQPSANPDVTYQVTKPAT